MRSILNGTGPRRILRLSELRDAQISTGNIYGAVTDESGAVLPGATVTLAGPSGTRSTVAGSQGDFRYLGLDPESWQDAWDITKEETLPRAVEITLVTGAGARATQQTLTVPLQVNQP